MRDSRLSAIELLDFVDRHGRLRVFGLAQLHDPENLVEVIERLLNEHSVRLPEVAAIDRGVHLPHEIENDSERTGHVEVVGIIVRKSARACATRSAIAG